MSIRLGVATIHLLSGFGSQGNDTEVLRVEQDGSVKTPNIILDDQGIKVVTTTSSIMGEGSFDFYPWCNVVRYEWKRGPW